jgi:MATE family multidrug resistance protein
MPANPTITLGNELRQLWRIAWPLLVAQTAQMGTGVVDTVMAGRYNDQDLAAIALDSTSGCLCIC